MFLLPTQVFVSAGLGLASLILLLFALGLLGSALRRRAVVRTVHRPERTLGTPVLERRSAARAGHPGLIGLAVAMLLLLFAGHYLVGLFFTSSAHDSDERVVTTRLKGPSGADLAVEVLGPADGPVLVLTHGWGADGREWSYFKNLADQYRLVTWDLPGLGASTAIPDGQYTMEKMAADLHAVVNVAGDRPVVLVGHSIGGMLNLTYARLYPADLGSRVKGIVQLNTTYTNPLRTTKNADQHLARQKSLYEPLLHVIELASPAVRAAGWLSYMSGLAHLQLASQSFAGTETRDELDFAARYAYRSSPDVVSRGVLAMMNWDATDALARISIPVLIMTGPQDTTTLPEASDVMKARMPQASLVVVDPAAHLGPIEQHERYTAEIRAFAHKALALRSDGKTTP